jgi:hypothetical protein
MFTQDLRSRFSRFYLFAPCAALILCNFLSAYYITTAGIYNGDFHGIPIEQSNLEVWVYACIASMPYLVLYLIILRVDQNKVRSIKLPKYFVIFSFVILILSLILTLTYGVGVVGKEIYQAPILLKPFIVVINRIDPVVLAGIMILSPYTKIRTAVLAAALLLMITLYRSSLQYVFFVMILLFYKFILSNANAKKINRNNNLKVVGIFFILTALIIYIAPDLYRFRDELRGSVSEEMEVEKFIFGKLIGRLSNLSALLIFESRYDIFNYYIDRLHSLSYLADTFKYFWGSFTKILLISHYDYFTSIIDSNAFGFYAMQTGVLPALGLSLLKSPIVMILDVFVTLLFIFYTIRLSTYFLGVSGKYLAMSLLIFAVLSGAPSQFSLPMINLAVIAIVLKIIKYFSIVSGKKL